MVIQLEHSFMYCALLKVSGRMSRVAFDLSCLILLDFPAISSYHIRPSLGGFSIETIFIHVDYFHIVHNYQASVGP